MLAKTQRSQRSQRKQAGAFFAFFAPSRLGAPKEFAAILGLPANRH